MTYRASADRRTSFVSLFPAVTAIAIYWQVNQCDFTNYVEAIRSFEQALLLKPDYTLA
jgi:hypothetical protein